ncbi:MAG: hypothetical protein GXY05_16335, partial [Clostridiales bacterium]|nr:hypothetical protein [Clostridiales bacterium]
RRGLHNELTDQRFSIVREQPESKPAAATPKSSRQPAAQPEERKNAADGFQSVRVLSLEAENTRLKGELADTTETVDILKNVIADYLKRDR